MLLLQGLKEHYVILKCFFLDGSSTQKEEREIFFFSLYYTDPYQSND